MDEYRVDMQDWKRWPKALIMRRVWSTNGHNRHREVRRYVPDGYAKEVEHENANLRHMMEYYTDWAHDEVLKARGRESRERASADRLRDRIHEIAADRDRLKELLEESEHDESMAWDRTCKAEAENAKLRELVSLMDKRDVLLPCWRGCDADCRFHGSHCERIGTLMDELGFEVE